ncbi:MAG: hypothetical protein Q9167_001041 [Letrouitia subvulpina]
MFEPLSALSCIGFAIGTLGFLVNSVSKVDERIDEIHGFEQIQTRIKEIQDLSEQIQRLLKAPPTLYETQIHDWDQLIRGNPFRLTAPSILDERKHQLLSKIRFTLFQNTALQEKVSRFKSQISGLETASRLLLRLNQSKDSNTEITREELLNISTVKAFINNLSVFAHSLYEHQQSHEGRIRWALELSPPEDEQALDPLQYLEAIHLDFFVRNILSSSNRAQRFRVPLPEESARIRQQSVLVFDEIHRIITNHLRCPLEVQSENLLELLEEPMSRSRPFRKMLTSGILSGAKGKSFDIGRAELAYGLAYRLILLWNTPWSLRLCSCGIRGTYLVQSGTRHAFKAHINTTHWDPPCYQDDEIVDHKLLLLGTTLAEIALTEPLSLRVEDEDVRFLFQEHLITKTELIGTLRKKCGRDNITKAVRYCLDFETNQPEGDLRPENLDDFRQNILLPLEKYHRIMIKHASSSSGKRLRNEEDVIAHYRDFQDD